MNAFWKYGFDAVSTSDLADTMGIERSSFYNAFKDRESVFLEALDLYRGFAPDAMLASIQPGEPVVPALRAMLRELCRVRARDSDARGCLVVNSIAGLVGTNETLGHHIETSVRAAIAVFETLLRQAIDQGEIKPVADIEASAGMIAAFLAGINSLSKVIRNEKPLWAICDRFLATLEIRTADHHRAKKFV